MTIKASTFEALPIGSIWIREGKTVKVIDNTEFNGQMVTTYEVIE